jgi:uncharacterized delta-60 repeat protein
MFATKVTQQARVCMALAIRIGVGRFWRAFVVSIAIILALNASSQNAQATDGDLDPSFGNAGKVATDFNNSTDWLSRVAVQADGKIVAIGDTHPSHRGALARYNADGTLDATFGNGGKVITVANVRESAAGLLILPDGKIMISGSIDFPSSSDSSFALLRFNADGSSDPTFGNGGTVTTNVGPNDDQAYAIALQSDGKIVAAGRRGIQFYPSEQRKGNVALARYNSDGSIDATFGNGGTVVNDFGQGLESYALSIMIQPDGKIIVAGESSYAFLVARYNSNGTLDTTFGNSGYALANFSSNWDGATDALLQPDGKIVLVGWSILNSPYDSFALARFDSDGSLDQSFGDGGKVLLADEGDLNALVLQADGKLIAIGSGNWSSDSSFHLLRFSVNGSLDSTFGSNGIVTTSFGQPTEGLALILQANGELLAGGITSSDQYFQNSDFALARYVVGAAGPTVVSRKAHGTAGIFDINLPLTGNAGIECRDGGPNSDYQVVFTFPSAVTLSGASVTHGPKKSARMAGSALVSGDGKTVMVNLTNVSDAQTVTITLSGVSDGTQTRNISVPMTMLLGDSTGNGAVNSSDVGQTKLQSGQTANASNFRSDVLANGVINATDVGFVKLHSGSG